MKTKLSFYLKRNRLEKKEIKTIKNDFRIVKKQKQYMGHTLAYIIMDDNSLWIIYISH